MSNASIKKLLLKIRRKNTTFCPIADQIAGFFSAFFQNFEP
jgi:hypothetical protein